MNQFGVQNCLKSDLNIVCYWGQFWMFLFVFLEVFGFFLGSFSFLLRFSGEASVSKNMKKLMVF